MTGLRAPSVRGVAPRTATPGVADPRTATPRVATPESRGLSPDAPVPLGTVVDLAPGLLHPAPDLLVGGSPRRLVRLSVAGVGALAELGAGPAGSPAAARLARHLTDTGMAVVRAGPADRPGRAAGAVTVVVPARDRAQQLDRSLRALDAPVTVVDDGSEDPEAIAAVCDAHGAGLLRRTVAGGPAAARNSALGAVATELVAFVDSDCMPPRGWIDALRGHLDDPLVAAVAPRVVGETRESPLDLGPLPGPVAPGTRVPYVPAAALLVRRDALGDGFDESLRFGEDVDLVWRLVDAGWRVRYDPSVVAVHDEPTALGARVRRSYCYGTSAGPLARRHGGAVSHLALSPAQGAAVAAVVAGRPVLGVAWSVVSVWSAARRLAAYGLPATVATTLSARAAIESWSSTGRWCRQLGLVPLGAIGALGALRAVRAVVFGLRAAEPGAVRSGAVRSGVPRPGSLRPGSRPLRCAVRRVAALALALGVLPAVAASIGRRRTGEAGRSTPVAPAADRLACDVAYGLGVYVGCARARTAAPLVPAVGTERLSPSSSPGRGRPARRPRRPPWRRGGAPARRAPR